MFMTFLFNLYLVQPTATLNGSSTTTVQEYSDVYYSCEGKKGVPTSTVSWYKGNKLEMKGKTLSKESKLEVTPVKFKVVH